MNRCSWILAGVLTASLGAASTAWAQRKDVATIENGQDIDLAVGENRTIPARDVKNYSEGVTGIVDIKLTSDNTQFVINGRRAGSTTLLLIKNDGTQITVNLNVFTRSPQAVEKELSQLLGNIPGISVRRLGARFVIDGAVASDADLKRVQHVATLYHEQVDSLVQLGTTAAPGGIAPVGPEKRFLIRIDFYFVQYDKNSSYGVGISWPSAFGGEALSAQFQYDFLAGTTRAATASLTNQPLPRLDLASRKGWAKVLKQATVIANNDTEATFQNGAEQNFPVNTGLTIGITRVQSGTELTVLPHYEPIKRELSMKLTADVSDLTASVSGTSLPGRTTSKLTTSVSLKLGQSIILSGIRTSALSHSVQGLPILSDIPILGLLFGSHSQSELQTEGAIFVVPSIIESVPTSSSELVDIALQKFKQYDGNVNSVNAYDKRPGGSVGIPH
jgi:pilus assembly protein CpaC